MRMPDRISGAVVAAAGVLALVLLLTFVAGAHRQTERFEDLTRTSREVWTRTIEQARMLKTWEKTSTTERALWNVIRERYAEALSTDDVRLAVSAQLTALAAHCGLEEVALNEIDPAELGAYATGMEEDESDIEGRENFADGEEDGWRDAATLAAQRAAPDPGSEGVRPFGFQMEFTAGFDALQAFLDGLQRGPAVIEVRRAALLRGQPKLRVELDLATYGRVDP